MVGGRVVRHDMVVVVPVRRAKIDFSIIVIFGRGRSRGRGRSGVVVATGGRGVEVGVGVGRGSRKVGNAKCVVRLGG